ncbi:MAG: hypothetical protein ABR571_16640 [Jatrophihabitans sp.]|uniref:hypothetical protein n=1 Tax=Jatrophihabitans sp. TaxID=1932789 RepID=UPI0039108835
MQPIPKPHLLDPDRMLVNDRGEFAVDHETRANALDKALKESCAYAEQLWEDLDGIRAYLLNSLPPDPRAPGLHPTASASPTGPDDEQGWENWINAYATVTSVLAGPHGDSGFGLGEARRAARDRRTAPILTLAADHPEFASAPPQPDRPPRPESEPAKPTSSVAKVAGVAVAALLVLRGLRPRRPAHSHR